MGRRADRAMETVGPGVDNRMDTAAGGLRRGDTVGMVPPEALGCSSVGGLCRSGNTGLGRRDSGLRRRKDAIGRRWKS